MDGRNNKSSTNEALNTSTAIQLQQAAVKNAEDCQAQHANLQNWMFLTKDWGIRYGSSLSKRRSIDMDKLVQQEFRPL